MTPAAEYGFALRTSLRAPRAAVWAHAMSMEGVNDELFPFARMTAPKGRRRLDAADVATGQRLFRSWILAFGVLPVDYDDLTFVELQPGRRFLERSPMGSQRLWEHERVVRDDGDGCIVVDRVRFRPRVPMLGSVQREIFFLVFRNRHRRLASRFGRAGASVARRTAREAEVS